MRLVVVESPFAGNRTLNTAYAKAALLDCLHRGEAPIASHLLYTQVLEDTNIEERRLGIDAGLAWAIRASASVVYQDLGISNGMKKGIDHALDHARLVEYRKLGDYSDFARFAGCRTTTVTWSLDLRCDCVLCEWLNTNRSSI
jgi:hypothetical protein